MGDYSRYSLHVTKNCNMICSYCYELENLREDKITDEEFITNIDNIMRDPRDVEIEFIGGEPLLRFDRIKLACTYITKNYPNKNVKYSVTTNGTIYSREVAEFFRHYDFLVCISLDGDCYSHNINRKFAISNIGTFDVVFQNAKSYRSILDNNKVMIHLTVNRYTIGRIFNNVKFLFENGFTCLSIGFVNKDFTQSFLMMMEDELKGVTHYFIELKKDNPDLILLPVVQKTEIRSPEIMSIIDGAVYLEHMETCSEGENKLPDMEILYYNILNSCYEAYTKSVRGENYGNELSNIR